jgi:putative DNA primase/helicase
VADDEQPRELSKRDDDLADLLLKTEVKGRRLKLADAIRFDHSKQQWHVWDSKRWAPDKTNLVYDMVHDQASKLLSAASGPEAKAIGSLLDRAKKDSVLKTLASRRGIAMVGDEWDPDPTLMAFSNGVLNLATGEFDTSPSPELLLSRSTRQKYDPDAKAPRFEQFLIEVMGGDPGLVVYLATVLGYAMFGWQREQKFWMWVGGGQNGKGTLAKAVTHAFGDYADTPSAELYMKTRFGAARSDAARPDLLRLQGVRFVWMSEPHGGQLNDEMLKAHTGDDPIQARDLYGKASSITTFRPTHKINFLTNDPPRTEDVGLSMRRRVRIIKFREDFTGAKEDKVLEEALKKETPGILALLTRFAKMWYENGLIEPPEVTEWSAEYMEDNDPLAAFVSEACIVGKKNEVFCSASIMWIAYQDWCARRDVEQGTQTGFGLAMQRRFERRKKTAGIVYLGVRAKNAGDLADD